MIETMPWTNKQHSHTTSPRNFGSSVDVVHRRHAAFFNETVGATNVLLVLLFHNSPPRHHVHVDLQEVVNVVQQENDDVPWIIAQQRISSRKKTWLNTGQKWCIFLEWLDKYRVAKKFDQDYLWGCNFFITPFFFIRTPFIRTSRLKSQKK